MRVPPTIDCNVEMEPFSTLRRTTLSASRAAAFEVKTGVAPPGWLAEDLSDWIGASEKAQS